MTTIQDKIVGLYIAFFNKVPDKENFDNWTTKVESNENVLIDIAEEFAQHTTFTDAYNGLDNKLFVETLYQEILGKEGDTQGIEHWQNDLNNGTSRSNIVLNFVDSALTADLKSDSFNYLTATELLTAQARQDLLTNKVAVSLDFIDKLGTATNIVNLENPETDDAYLASIKILSEITEDTSTMQTAIALNTLLATDKDTAMVTLNNLENITTDTALIDMARPNDDSTLLTITYSTETFVEDSSNDGSISETLTITLEGSETFSGTNGEKLTGAVVSNIPTGLIDTIIKTSDTTADLTFAGNASSHENADDISNLTITLDDTSFTGGDASVVTGASKNDISIDFMDATSELAPSPSAFMKDDIINLVNDEIELSGINIDNLTIDSF